MPETKKQPRKKRQGWLLPICYAIGVLVYLGICLFQLLQQNAWVQDGTQQKTRLDLQDFTLESIRLLEKPVDEQGSELVTDCIYQWQFVSTDHDPQMLYAQTDGSAFAPGVVTLQARANRPTGEIVLYYETKPGQGYSDTRRVWAYLDEFNDWKFDLTGKKVYSIRLDPDSVEPGVLWDFAAVFIGGEKTAAEIFTPTPFAWLRLLTLPLLGWAALRESFAALDYAVTGHILRKRQQAKNEK